MNDRSDDALKVRGESLKQSNQGLDTAGRRPDDNHISFYVLRIEHYSMSQLSSFIRQMRLHIRNFGFVDHVANLPSVDFRLPATILKALFINRQTLAVDILHENAGDHPDMFQEGRHGPEGPFNIVFLGLQQCLQRIAVANATNKSEMGSVPLFNHAEDTRATGAADQCGMGIRLRHRHMVIIIVHRTMNMD